MSLACDHIADNSSCSENGHYVSFFSKRIIVLSGKLILLLLSVFSVSAVFGQGFRVMDYTVDIKINEGLMIVD